MASIMLLVLVLALGLGDEKMSPRPLLSASWLDAGLSSEPSASFTCVGAGAPGPGFEFELEFRWEMWRHGVLLGQMALDVWGIARLRTGVGRSRSSPSWREPIVIRLVGWDGLGPTAFGR
jgi:hypothetical protein